MTKELQPRILVFGVGGAGGNAINNMIEADLQGVEFIVANTDAQALGRARTDKRIQLGLETTEGLGAGARPEVGAAAAEESLSQVEEMLEGAHMVFIAAGMGGGTGTGAAPVIAKAARERGVLTVGVVTKPFAFEGRRRMEIAEQGLREISRYVDTMIVVPNQNLFRVANESTTFADAFRMADDVLYAGVRGITDLMVMPGLINLDFADVRATMSGMGSAMMGMGEAEGENRALEAARRAIENPLLDDVSLTGAQGVLINITGGYDMTLFELDEAANEVRAEVDPNATIILGSTFDPDLEGKIRVSVVAAGLAGQVFEKDEPEEVAETTASTRAEPAPVVVTPAPLLPPGQSNIDEPEPDLREDFVGRTLPIAEAAGSEGSDHVAADMAFAKRPAPAPADAPEQAQRETTPAAAPSAGFSNLFGWRKGSDNDDKDGQDAIISSPETHPEPADFDDADLEIPAFLRRSANH